MNRIGKIQIHSEYVPLEYKFHKHFILTFLKIAFENYNKNLHVLPSKEINQQYQSTFFLQLTLEIYHTQLLITLLNIISTRLRPGPRIRPRQDQDK